VLVSGGGSGIGAAMVTLFAAQGAKVAFIDIADDASRALEASVRASGLDARYWRCDVTDIALLQRTIADIEGGSGCVEQVHLAEAMHYRRF